MTRQPLASVLCLIAAGCSQESAVLVTVRGDVEPGSDVDRVEVSLWADGAQAWSGGEQVSATSPLPVRFRIRQPAAGVDTADVAVAASLDRRTVLEVRRAVGFVSGEEVGLEICLWRACIGSPDDRCTDGRCDLTPIGADADGDVDADPADASPDADPVDADADRGEPDADRLDAGADAEQPGDADAGGDADAEVAGCLDPVCDLWPQCGCPEGEKCVHDAAGNRLCFEDGTLPHGTPCDGGCVAGTSCAGVGAEPRYCAQYCSENEDCAAHGPGSACTFQLNDSEGSLIASACTVDCDPVSLTPTECAAGIRCELRGEAGQNYTHCLGSIGSGLAGDPCDPLVFSADCAAGYVCLSGSEECARLCERGFFADCPDGETCHSVSPSPVLGTITLGYCAP